MAQEGDRPSVLSTSSALVASKVKHPGNASGGPLTTEKSAAVPWTHRMACIRCFENELNAQNLPTKEALNLKGGTRSKRPTSTTASSTDDNTEDGRLFFKGKHPSRQRMQGKTDRKRHIKIQLDIVLPETGNQHEKKLHGHRLKSQYPRRVRATGTNYSPKYGRGLLIFRGLLGGTLLLGAVAGTALVLWGLFAKRENGALAGEPVGGLPPYGWPSRTPTPPMADSVRSPREIEEITVPSIESLGHTSGFPTPLSTPESMAIDVQSIADSDTWQTFPDLPLPPMPLERRHSWPRAEQSGITFESPLVSGMATMCEMQQDAGGGDSPGAERVQAIAGVGAEHQGARSQPESQITGKTVNGTPPSRSSSGCSETTSEQYFTAPSRPSSSASDVSERA